MESLNELKNVSHVNLSALFRTILDKSIEELQAKK